MFKRRIKNDDFNLIKRITRGDEAAFRKLYDMTYGVVQFYLKRRVKDDGLIEAVLVQTYAAVWKGARSFKGKSKVATWMIGIARNLLFKALRKKRYHNIIDNYYGFVDGSNTEMMTHNRRELLKQGMLSLSSTHLEVLDLIFFHEMSYTEVASLLNVPVNTIKTRIFYAKTALKKQLAKTGISDDDI